MHDGFNAGLAGVWTAASDLELQQMVLNRVAQGDGHG